MYKENEELKKATDGLLKIQYALADSCNKKETALEEIKEIAEKEYKTPLGEKDCMNCDDSFKRIENIITEAIGGNYAREI